MGGKIRDTEDEFLGAKFRDDKTKLMYAYDYHSKTTVRIWGTTFKPAMYKELKRLGVTVVDRHMITDLLTEKGKKGNPIIGAVGFNNRTGEFLVISSVATIMATSRPARIWLFSESYPGLSEFRPTQCIGDGHAMGWRAGLGFTMMEKSVVAEFSAAGHSFPPYGAGNNHNTWYPATLVDSNGKELPYKDRDGKILKTYEERTKPSENQALFMKGGNIDQAKYAYEGPETIPFDQAIKEGFVPPFYADLSSMPKLEREVIWGMMVGEEGKTKIPILQNYQEAGFDPKKHMLQCYGGGWKSANFSPDQRQLFGLPGGFFNDWKLMSTSEGLFVSGDALFASNCFGHAASTGSYAGRHAANYSDEHKHVKALSKTIETHKSNVYMYLNRDIEEPLRWKEINSKISKIMRNYCGAEKHGNILNTGLKLLNDLEGEFRKRALADNPHELMRLLEVKNILTVSKLIIHASLERKCSTSQLEFSRIDSDSTKKAEEQAFIVIKQEGKSVVTHKVPLDYYGNLKENYELHNSVDLKEVENVL
jgi:succinate dehydrogenase/fumarate reductase flavoprotein subunit